MSPSKLFPFLFVLLFFSCYYEDIPRATSNTPDPNLCVGSTLTATSQTQSATGCGKNDGTITITATGGVAPYQYSLNGGAKQSSNVFSALAGGTYSVVIYDSKPCSFTLNGISVSSAGTTLAATATVTANTGCITPNGSVQLSATGGTGPYQYSFNSSAFSSTTSYPGLAAGNYSAAAKDSKGCAVSINVSIVKGTSTSYANVIKPLIETKCAFSNCHASNAPSVDLTTWTNVNKYAASIKTRTADGSMPKAPKPGGSLTADQIKQIACWVDEGALNN